MLYKRCNCPEHKCKHPWHYEFRHEGRQYRKSTRTANRVLAERIESRRHTKVLDGKDVEDAPKITLKEHIKAYVEHTAKTNTTAYKDQAVLDRFAAIAGADRLLSDISAFQVERWKLARAESVSRATVNRELNIVRGLFSRAVEWNRLGSAPTVSVKPFRVDGARLRVCSPEEIQTLLAGLTGDLKLLAKVTLESLLRLSEALNLRASDIGASWVEVRRKGGKVQRVPITPELRTELLERAHKSSGYVFGKGWSGKPPMQQAVSVAYTRAIRALGLKGISHHVFRHTGATLMVQSGVSLRALQVIGGWSSLRMVERYAHVDDAELQRAVRQNHERTLERTEGSSEGAKSEIGGSGK